jgi:hypothetical protein
MKQIFGNLQEHEKMTCTQHMKPIPLIENALNYSSKKE